MFVQGEKIVCVSPGRDLNLVKDEIYTVVEATSDVVGDPSVMLLEVMPPEPFHNYLANRFRKVTPADMKKLEKVELIES